MIMEKECKHCELTFTPKAENYHIEQITGDDKVDIQLTCPSCEGMVEYTFVHQEDFMPDE